MAATAWQTASLKVYDRDATTLRGTVKADGVRWTDELKGSGGASYSVAWLQAALQASPDLLREAVVKVGVPLTQGAASTEVFGWLSQPGSGVLVSEEEDAGKQENPECLGLRALLDDWIVLHDGGLQSFGGETRSFGWMSSAYSDAAWSVPIARRWDQDTNTSRAGYPEVFETVDPAAAWLGKEDPSTGLLANGAIRYFRGTYTNTEERVLRVIVAGDNYVELYVNGEPWILWDDQRDAYGWRDHFEPDDRKFAAGPILFAARVKNAALTTGSNPVAFILTVLTLDANGNPDRVVFRSNATNFKVTDAVVGLTSAKILLQLLSEANTRGIASAGRIVPSFTATTATNGTAWPDLQEMAIEVGEKGSTTVERFEATAFDLDMRPNLALNAYLNQGSDKSATVAITQGVNLLSYSYEGQPLVATRLLVRTSDQWLYLTDTGAEVTYSPREHYLESGLSLTSDQGELVGDANLSDLARVAYTYTAVIVCTDAAGSWSPYGAAGKGDLVNAYNYKMQRQALQIVSISGEVPPDGIVRWTLELREP